MSEKSIDSILDAPNSYPPWAPRIWTGFLPREYWSLLSENRFSIHPARYPMTGIVSFFSVVNSIFAGVQKIGWSSAIEDTQLREPPIFIVGHWRSGTTLLHELMSLDENLAFPSNFDAFVPAHFLVSGSVIKPLIRALLPRKRPMDNMTVGVDSPQEDDFAIMVLGGASHYRRMGFPNGNNDYARWLDSANLQKHELQKIQDCLRYFYQALTYKYQKRLILKSPPHTGRIRFLSEWFPNAKFVHISRHPHAVVPSTMRLWAISDDVQAFHPRKYNKHQLLSYVNDCQQFLYDAYLRDRQCLQPEQLAEVRYEDLTTDPVGTIDFIYRKLGMDGFDHLKPSVEDYFQRKSGHKKNRHNIEGIKDLIDEKWARYSNSFGFSSEKTKQKTA